MDHGERLGTPTVERADSKSAQCRFKSDSRHMNKIEEATSIPAAPVGAAGPANTLRILVAEDEAIIRLDLVEMLTEAGYEVVAEATNGLEAIAFAKQFLPDISILDVKMPELDGISAAEQIIEISPVLMLTAFSQRELVERARDAGAMAYVVKPFSISDLVPAIEIAVSRHREQKALQGEVADLQDRLETRKIIDRAKGILMKTLNLSEPESFSWIQRTAMDRRISMKDVARAVFSPDAVPDK
jgi:AmiR/NasT family two-component response regulator